MRSGAPCFILAAILAAQEVPVPQSAPPQTPPPVEQPKRPPALEYTGKPIRVPFECTDEDITGHGLTCTTDEPCHVYLELAAMETVGVKIFLSGNLHTSNTTLWSILLVSEDSGKTWSEPYERMRSTGLDQIQFFDFEVGWISGQSLVALPRDPFFLVTSDGGKTWRHRPVFGESRGGLIEQFWFDSRTSGSLLVDSGGRREMYESMTGGESWMLRQVGPRAAGLKRTRPPNSDWRLRADGALKAYRVEKRQGERWQTISSFLIQSGECKPPERVLAEPPPEPTAPAVEELQIGPRGTTKKAPSLKKPRP